ncbi:hypothetical protein chiPu_0030404, partial [Chiloscyllium punctatum]|nr:hypothetical protein [Chiloscyllium punctatum]
MGLHVLWQSRYLDTSEPQSGHSSLSALSAVRDGRQSRRRRLARLTDSETVGRESRATINQDDESSIDELDVKQVGGHLGNSRVRDDGGLRSVG